MSKSEIEIIVRGGPRSGKTLTVNALKACFDLIGIEAGIVSKESKVFDSLNVKVQEKIKENLFNFLCTLDKNKQRIIIKEEEI